MVIGAGSGLTCQPAGTRRALTTWRASAPPTEARVSRTVVGFPGEAPSAASVAVRSAARARGTFSEATAAGTAPANDSRTAVACVRLQCAARSPTDGTLPWSTWRQAAPAPSWTSTV
jgi:hypothetical protein